MCNLYFMMGYMKDFLVGRAEMGVIDKGGKFCVGPCCNSKTFKNHEIDRNYHIKNNFAQVKHQF